MREKKEKKPCTCFNINQYVGKQKNNSSTLERAHKLKWTIYSFFVIPPFPTSSISGSVEFTRSMDIVTLNWRKYLSEKHKVNEILTIPTTRSCILCINFIHICPWNHAAKDNSYLYQLKSKIIQFWWTAIYPAWSHFKTNQGVSIVTPKYLLSLLFS